MASLPVWWIAQPTAGLAVPLLFPAMRQAVSGAAMTAEATTDHGPAMIFAACDSRQGRLPRFQGSHFADPHPTFSCGPPMA